MMVSFSNRKMRSLDRVGRGPTGSNIDDTVGTKRNVDMTSSRDNFPASTKGFRTVGGDSRRLREHRAFLGRRRRSRFSQRPQLARTLATGRILLRAVTIVLITSLVALSAETEEKHCRQAGEVDAAPIEYRAIAVSGGLQTGFPDHVKMHYRGMPRMTGADGDVSHSDDEAEVVKALFVGRALVRGCRAYLDVMQPGWRQYSPEPQQPLINSVVMVTGCHEHANQYWVYLVDSRQFLSILNNEPRFLAITPDTGLVDLESNETEDAVRHFAFHELNRREVDGVTRGAKMDRSTVAIPMVVAIHYHESFISSPPIRAHADGTLITNFPESLALWANVSDADRTATISAESERVDQACQVGDEKCISPKSRQAQRQQRYWDGIRAAIRRAEANPLPGTEWRAQGPPWKCQRETRLGTSAQQLRINYPLTAAELIPAFRAGGYRFDPVHGQLLPSP